MRFAAGRPKTTSYVVLATPKRDAVMLRVNLETQEQLEREYESRLADGRIFAPTDSSPASGSSVQVAINVEPCGTTLFLAGAVVECGVEEPPGRVGVIVELDLASERARDLIGSLVPAARGDSTAMSSDRRAAPRVPAQLHATVEGGGQRASGRTLNLSATGVLISLAAGHLSVGDPVRLSLFCEETDEQVALQGHIARHVTEDERCVGAGIRFEAPGEPHAEQTLAGFIERERARQAGSAISGPVQKMGIANLIQTFANASGRGVLRIANGAEEGWVTFSHGEFLGAKLGCVAGKKALTRMIGWDSGWFEFRVSDELKGTESAPVSLDAVLLDALRLLDELGRIDRSRLPDSARVVAVEETIPAGDGDPGEETIEGSILEQSGHTVAEILDHVDAPDVEIYEALERLLDRGGIELRS